MSLCANFPDMCQFALATCAALSVGRQPLELPAHQTCADGQNYTQRRISYAQTAHQTTVLQPARQIMHDTPAAPKTIVLQPAHQA